MTTIPPLRLLLVEDEALIAMTVQAMIVDLGHSVVRNCSTVDSALAACAEGGFDAALIDMGLDGESGTRVADRLKADGMPFAFATGYGISAIDPAHGDVPVLAKPYAIAELEGVLDALSLQLAGTNSITSSVDSKRG